MATSAFVGTNPENEAQPKVNECIALITPVEVHGETSSSPHQLHGQPDRKARRPGSATLMCEYPSDAISHIVGGLRRVTGPDV